MSRPNNNNTQMTTTSSSTTTTTSSSKRKRKENPPSWLHNESLAAVASPLGDTIRTKVVSAHDKDIFLDRLDKELVRSIVSLSLSLSLNRSSSSKHNAPNSTPEKEILPKSQTDNKIWKQRVVMGTNQCTRILETLLKASNSTKKTGNNNQSTSLPKQASSEVPSLIVLARDIYPPTMLSHIPVMAQFVEQHHNGSIRLPILLLPGQASRELGKVLGTKRVSIMMFLPNSTIIDDDTRTTKSTSTNMSGDKQEKLSNEEIQRIHDRITSFVEFVKKTILP